MRRVFKYLGMLLALELIIFLGAVIPAQATMTITLSSSSGSPGTALVASGFSTTPSDTVTITFDNTTTLATTTAGPSGSWSVSVAIPQAASNVSHTIYATGAGGSSSASFTITPKVNVSRLSGSAGNTVTVSGSGFAQK